MNYDWIIIGAGITGAALGYELAKAGFSVLLLEQDRTPNNATRYSYGGLAYWSGISKFTTQLCNQAKQRYLQLSEELETDIEFRELDLILTIDANTDPQASLAKYARFAVTPQLLTPQEACKLEPLLNSQAISGALTVKHGHINPEVTAQAYCQAMQRCGGTLKFTQVLELVCDRQITDTQQVIGVKTPEATYFANNTVVCAGGLTRQLLQAAGIPIRVYYSHAEFIETVAVEPKLHTLVMPANQIRFALEAASSTDELDSLWDEPGNELLPAIFDPGAIQFLGGRILLGQISRVLTDVNAHSNPQTSEAKLRAGIRQILPDLADLPGTWQTCLVAFSATGLPIVGPVPNIKGIHVFSGFTNPLVYTPPLAQRFAAVATGKEDLPLTQLAPQPTVASVMGMN